MRFVLILPMVLAACTSEISGAERGEELFRSTSVSPTDLNVFTCATCHETDEGAALTGGGLSGYNLHGVANRAPYWGGDRATLRDAVDACLVFFMKAPELDPDSADTRAIFDYLQSISPADAPSEPLEFSVIETIVDVERGDAARGETVFEEACERCHGAAFTANGSILRIEYNLPEITESYPQDFPGVDPSLVVIEKIRHGRFFDIGGDMPLFSVEAMSDADIGALLTFLDL